MIQIITDSAADITLQQAAEMNIHIVPISITFPDGPCPQEKDEDFFCFYQRLSQAENLPITSQPAPEAYLRCFAQAKEAGDTVLVLTLSGGLSGTINAANMAKELYGYDKVHIMDTGLAIAAQRMLVEYAVQLRNEGVEIEEMVKRLEGMKSRVTVYGILDDLDNLRKGGRIPQSLAVLGNTLKIKPVIVLEDKILKTIGKSMGRSAGKKLVYRQFEEHSPDPDFPVYFLYTSDKDIGEKFMQETIEKYGLDSYNTCLIPVGGVIGTHIGRNCMGISYVIKESKGCA